MFNDLKKPELLEVAEAFGVEVNPKSTNSALVAKIEEDGVTWEAYQDYLASTTEVIATPTKKESNEQQVLMKMRRDNFSYQIRGINFTRTHPFALVPETDAEWIAENVDGIAYATPKEVQEYYK